MDRWLVGRLPEFVISFRKVKDVIEATFGGQVLLDLQKESLRFFSRKIIPG